LAVRLIDFNEKESMWAVLMLFVFGGTAAVVLDLTVGSGFLSSAVVSLRLPKS